MLALPSGFLLLPPPCDRNVERLLRKVRLRAARALLALAADASPLPPARRMALLAVQRCVEDGLRRAPEPLLRALGSPAVLPSLLCLDSGAWPAPACIAEAVPHVLAELWARRGEGLLSESLQWPGPVDYVVADSLGLFWRFDPPARALLSDPAGLSVELADGRRMELGSGAGPRTLAGEPAFLPLARTPGAGGPTLALLDRNPLYSLEDHPNKSGNALDLGGRAPTDWAAALHAAVTLVAGTLPDWASELPLLLRRAVPVGFQPERHLSASYREAPGLVYLSLHPSPLTLAEAIVHECQHGKLNLLSHVDEVLHNARSTWTESPVRPDLRPILGVLLAAHAFVPVAALHARAAELGLPLAVGPDFDRRRAEVLRSNAGALATVERLGQPSELGAALLRDLRRLHDTTVEAAPRALRPGLR
jgi:HEXXH motif-containing protein